jgi:hypothetical protein
VAPEKRVSKGYSCSMAFFLSRKNHAALPGFLRKLATSLTIGAGGRVRVLWYSPNVCQPADRPLCALKRRGLRSFPGESWARGASFGTKS